MYFVNKEIKDLYRVKPAQGRGDFLRLDMNENPEGLPETFVRGVLAQITSQELAMYPEIQPLLEALATHLAVDTEQIAVTNGSDEAIKTVFDLFAEKGKNIVTVYPTFEMYAVYAKMYGMEHIAIEYAEDFSLSYDAFYAAINEQTKIVAVLNPNNPIGTVFSEEEVVGLIKKAQSVGAIVVIDEAYHYFYPQTFLHLVNQFDHVILLRTFSKLCSIAGCRLGYAVSNPYFVELLNKARPTYGINCVGIKLATGILRHPTLMKELIAAEQEGKRYIIKQLEDNRYAYFYGNGNYVFIKPRTAVAELKQRFYHEKVLVKTYSHPLLAAYIRITTGGIETMKRFFALLVELDRKN